MPVGEVERLRAKGGWMNVELSERDRDTDKQERRERIRESRFNRRVWEVYDRKFRSTWGERVQKERKMMARFRCVNEKREKRYWMKERKAGAECAMRRERPFSTRGMDVAKCERRRERSGEKY
jgi:hypothetical protein